MKLLLLSAVLASSFILAQQSPIGKDTDIKVLQRSTTLLRDPLPSPDKKPIRPVRHVEGFLHDLSYTATKIRREGDVVKLSGNVKVLKPDAFLMVADEVEYHEYTGELIPSGSVRIFPIAPPEKR